jgi:hypothetical protein
VLLATEHTQPFSLEGNGRRRRKVTRGEPATPVAGWRGGKVRTWEVTADHGGSREVNGRSPRPVIHKPSHNRARFLATCPEFVASRWLRYCFYATTHFLCTCDALLNIYISFGDFRGFCTRAATEVSGKTDISSQMLEFLNFWWFLVVFSGCLSWETSGNWNAELLMLD